MNKLDRTKEIEQLNSEALLPIRKNFGMFSDVQFKVIDIKDDNSLIVNVASRRTDFSFEKNEGAHLPSKGKIMNNIIDSILQTVGEKYPSVEISWVEWSEDDGYGFLVGNP